MAAPLRIRLRQLESATYLESAGGTVVTSGGQSRLDGAFAIVVAGQQSDAVEFSAATRLATVVASGSDWILQSLVRTVFAYSTPLKLADGAGPWLSCTVCSLTQPDAADAMAMVSLEDVRASLTAAGPDPGAKGLSYPTQAGNQTGALTPVAHPQHPSFFGFFLIPFESGYVVQLGMLQQGVSINHAVATDILVQSDSNLLFPISNSIGMQTRLLFDSTNAAVGAVVRTAQDSGLLMTMGPSAGSWSRIRLPTDRIEVKGGWLRVTQFRPKDAWLGHVTDASAPFDDATALFTSTNRLGYELELLTAQPSVRFVYNDASLGDASPVVGSDRFYGLKIAGLGSRTGIRPTLDATQLRFELTKGANPQFHLKAGLGDGSLLVPKPNAKSGGSRMLDVPVSGELALRVTAAAIPTSTAMQLDTESGKFTLNSPVLLSAPVGITAQIPSATTDSGYARWALKPDTPEVIFGVGAGRLVPDLGQQWLNHFHTADPSARYSLIEHPGTQLTIDGASLEGGLARFAGITKTKTEITTKQAGGKEIVAYSAFFTVLSWAAAKCVSQGTARCLDEKQFKVAFPSLDDSTLQQFIKRNGLQDLQVVYYSALAGAHAQIKEFVDGNMGTPLPDKYQWPFTAGLSVLLYDQVDSPKLYCDEIAAARKHTKSCLAFDFSSQAALNPADLGYAADEWKALIDASPMLWPRGSGRGGARLDPTEKIWRGIFVRDMPLFLPIPPVVGSDFPFLKNLIDGINQKLVLDYGWRDESGTSWFGGLEQSFDDGRFTPDAWKNTLEMSILSVSLKGAAGSIVTAQATCALRLNRLINKATGKPLEFEGTFGLDLISGGNPITRIDLTQDGQPIATDSLPGFAAVALKRIATDFKTAQFELLLTATPELASALPFLSSQTPQLAILAFNLQGSPSLTLSLALAKEVETNLFGRWPLTIQAISVQFGANPDDSNVELRIRGRLHLGMAEFASVGATVVVKRTAAGTKFGIELDSISGSLTVGDVHISGSFEWKDKNNNSGLVDLTGAASAGQVRELWGSIVVEDPGVIGKNLLAVRVGNQGEVSFWIGTITTSTDIPLGIGRLKNPALLLAHNADFGGNLSKVITDPTGSLLQVLRPDFSNEPAITDWLSKWGPSSTIGNIIAGSGYVQLQSGIADAPVKDGKIDPTQLSSLLFTDRGLFRVDGVLAMLGTATMRFGLAIDYKNFTITAGLQAPSFKLPTPEDPQYEISAGYITIGLSFAGHGPYLRIGIGWPERIGGTEFERDWSKATKVYVSSMWPINTFWGGYLAELRTDKVVFGFAIRAGWTKNYSVGGGIAKGSAELGITLGGVFQFGVIWDGAHGRPQALELLPARSLMLSPPSYLLADSVTPHYDIAAHVATIAAALGSFDASLARLAGVDIAMSAEIFGDIWGKASVEFLGVTLLAVSVRAYARFRVCGTLTKGITQAKAEVGFEVSVTILCITYHATAQVDVTLIDGDCPLINAANSFVVPGQFLTAAPIPASAMAVV
ncbi:MAG: hypothetical protein LAO78_06535 [Acidobacteriia bacterium]|nr:hypothetical protein [Terriglobia bacterium]